MGRGPKPAKSKEAKPPAARKSRKNEASTVRDLKEHLAEALAQQAATSEILRVISSSLSDLQPIMDTVAEYAARLCEASDAQIFLLEGDTFHLAASHGPLPPARLVPETRGSVAGRAVIDRQTIHVRDIATEPVVEFPDSLAKGSGWRTVLAEPLLRRGVPIGTIVIRRTEVRPFSDKQLALLKTFADQAVIAIENVRLFNETKEALERQTATSEILRVISQSQTDVQPVFDTIAENARLLFRAWYAAVYRLDGEFLQLVARRGGLSGPMEPVHERVRVDRGSLRGRAILDRALVHIADIATDRDVTEMTRRIADSVGWRSALFTPMLRDGEPIGLIVVTRAEPGAFSDGEVALLQTFADQAVIAIENVRLFKELEVANRELAAASQHKSEFLANMSHELRTPLNAIIGFSEVLSEKMFGELNEKQEEYSKDIYTSGTHLLSLINDILDLSKIEAGRMELELTDFHLPTAFDSALTLVRERAGRRGIALHLSVDEQLGQIQADERKVRQVVLNLLSNAIKFTPEGGRIELAAVPKDGLVEVSVSDTGVGIAPEDQEAVFEEFRQVGTAEKKVEGTGLGLTLCRKFVELHGGGIWVKSQVGAGSTFTFAIPARRGE